MSFNFSDKTYAIEICGKQYFLVAGDVDSLVALRKLFDQIAEVDKMDKDSLEFIQAHEPIVRDFLDGIFGEGSYAEIFAGRRVNLSDMMELVEYVGGELQNLPLAQGFAEKAADILEVADDKADL